jgi:hypothetical protein
MQGRCSSPCQMGERDGNMPQDRPPVEGRRPPSARNRSQQAPNRGAYSAYGDFSAHFISCGSAVYHPVGPSPGALSRLSRLSLIFRIFLQAPIEARVPRDNCLICFRPLLGPTPQGRTGSYGRGEYSAGRSYTAVRSVDGLDAPYPAIVTVERVSHPDTKPSSTNKIAPQMEPRSLQTRITLPPRG